MVQDLETQIQLIWSEIIQLCRIDHRGDQLDQIVISIKLSPLRTILPQTGFINHGIQHCCSIYSPQNAPHSLPEIDSGCEIQFHNIAVNLKCFPGNSYLTGKLIKPSLAE